jgi:hypothetical protein
MMTYQGSTPEQLCKGGEDSPSCTEAAAWLSDILLIDHDLFAGRQHALKLMHLAPVPSPDLHANLED